ncbi:hypothetical protein [Cryobacterium sp. Y50]|uniref:hypothetical protein n=1 Tax=Cryobacterium sp. Y50 TaxID=2048286 RepID=UPI001304BCFA|nr:hypothetical protein [Cryobacterium sp. Y50]
MSEPSKGLADDIEGPFDPLFPPMPRRRNIFGVVTELAAAPVGPSGFWFDPTAGRVREGFGAEAAWAGGLELDGFGAGVG